MNRQTIVIAICLGVVSAMGPLAMDMYLSAMPIMAREMAAKAGDIELSMFGFLLGYCAGQLFFGPISDAFGRKPILLFGLIIFIFASIGCLFSTDITSLTIWRIVQGIGASVGMVISVAAVRDMYTGSMATRLMGLIFAVFSIAPVLGPIVGSLILTYGSWQGIFIFLAVISFLATLLVVLTFPETTNPTLRKTSKPSRALGIYMKLLRSHDFIPYALSAAMSQANLFVYIAGSSFLLIDLYKLSPMQFAFAFAANALGLTLATQIGGLMTTKIGPRKTTIIATALRAVASVMLVLIYFLDLASLPIVLVMLFLCVALYGLVLPSSSVLALDKQASNAGTASALLGALGFGSGALGSALLSFFANGTAAPLFILMAVTAIGAAIISYVFFERWESDAVVS